MKPTTFLSSLAAVRLEAVFNPYSDRCTVYDLPDAPERRRRNLLAVLNAASSGGVHSLWIGRDLGYRGGRRTGLALTDEVHLGLLSRAWGGLPVMRATVGPLMAERTAATVWEMLNRVREPVFLWNLFPFHPHEPAEPFSNRAHTADERRLGEEFLSLLLGIVRPSCIVAIGGDASRRLAQMSIRHESVRHPSYGGRSEFCEGIRRLYQLPESRDSGGPLQLL